MIFPRGRFDTVEFTEDDNQITIKDWISPTLFNAGDQKVIFNGQSVEPGDSFVIGAPNIRLNGTFAIRFSGAGTKKAIINYAVLDKTNNCNN